MNLYAYMSNTKEQEKLEHLMLSIKLHRNLKKHNTKNVVTLLQDSDQQVVVQTP